MAIDMTKPVIGGDRYVRGDRGPVISDRLGQDDGNDFTAGDVVRDLDGVVSMADARARDAYTRQTEVKAAGSIIDGASPTLRQVVGYLKAKHPEDFA